jgi:AraC family transcriptional regulator
MSQTAMATTPRATVTAEINSEMATAQVVRYDMEGPVDSIKTPCNTFWIDLCLTPRPVGARACYPDRWTRNRFESIGEAFFVPPQESLHAKSSGGTQTSVICQLDPDSIARFIDCEAKWSACRLEAGLDIRDLSIRGMLLRLARELLHPGFATELLVDLLVAQVAIEVARYGAAAEEERIRGGLSAWRLRAIEERMKQSGKAPSLLDLAQLCGLSVRQLSRGFRTSRGCSIGQYIERERIENAKRLLLRGESIKSIAYTMGFASPSSFSYAFRRKAGISPAEYRNRV